MAEHAAVLNVADDHTDWHGSFAAYRDAKARILERAGVAVADAGDPVASALVATHPHPVTVTLGEPGPGQLGVRAGALVDRIEFGNHLPCLDDLVIFDQHPGDDVAPGRVGQGGEHPVHGRLVQLICNHVVVR